VGVYFSLGCLIVRVYFSLMWFSVRLGFIFYDVHASDVLGVVPTFCLCIIFEDALLELFFTFF